MSFIRWFRRISRPSSSLSPEASLGPACEVTVDSEPGKREEEIAGESSSEVIGFEKVSFATAESLTSNYSDASMHRECANCGAGMYRFEEEDVSSVEALEEGLAQEAAYEFGTDPECSVCTCGEEGCRSKCGVSFPSPSHLRFSPHPLVLEEPEEEEDEEDFEDLDCFCSLECKWSFRFADELKLRQTAKLRKRQALIQERINAEKAETECEDMQGEIEEAPTQAVKEKQRAAKIRKPGFTPGGKMAPTTSLQNGPGHMQQPALISSRRLTSINPA